MSLAVRDGNNVMQTLSTTQDGANALVGATAVTDPVSGAKAAVQQFHTTDDQSLAGTANGLLTGGVAQLLNAAQGLDRQVETGRDNITASGIASGTQQLKSRLATSLVLSLAAAANTATLAQTKFSNRGTASWLSVGSILTLEPGTTQQESVRIAAVNYATGVVTFSGLGTNRGALFAHAANAVVASGSYNEAVDATVPDGSTPAGVAASGSYLFNAASNAGAGGVEFARSFAGELMGATGTGASIAVSFTDTSGGPTLASGPASGQRLMPVQGLLGTGRAAGTITATGAGSTSIAFGSAAATNTLPAGHAVLLSGGAAAEIVFVNQSWVPGSSATVPLQSPAVNAGQTTAAWSVFAAAGPGLNGFLPHGIGVAEEALYDPVTGLFYLERSATQDALTPQNVGAHAPALWNGATFDRQTGSAARGADVNTRAGFSNQYNITTATLIRAGSCRAVRISVIVAGTGPGTANDCATLGAVAVGNQFATIPNTAGTVLLVDWPCGTGLVVAPGAGGQVLAVSYT